MTLVSYLVSWFILSFVNINTTKDVHLQKDVQFQVTGVKGAEILGFCFQSDEILTWDVCSFRK